MVESKGSLMVEKSVGSKEIESVVETVQIRALLVVVTMDSLKDCAKDDAKEYGLVVRKAVEQVGH